MNFKPILGMCKKAVMAWIDDYAPSMGAAISYYTVFSLAPLLIIVIAIAGAVFGRDAVQGQIVSQLSGLIGEDGATAVQGLIKSASDPGKGLVASIISFVILAVGATTVFAELQSALDRIWHVPEKAKPSGIWGVLQARFLSFGLVLGLAFMMMVSLVVAAGVAAFGNWTSELAPGWEVVLQVINIAVSLGITTLLFAMIYKLMPSVAIAWRDVWVGAGVTAVLFEVGKLLIGLYIGKSGVTESFAAAGSLVVLLAWVYYAAQIFLLGAEFTKVYANERNPVAIEEGETPGQQAATGHAGDTPEPTVPNGLELGQIRESHEKIVDVDRRLQLASNKLIRQMLLHVAAIAAEVAAARWHKRKLRQRQQLYKQVKKLS